MDLLIGSMQMTSMHQIKPNSILSTAVGPFIGTEIVQSQEREGGVYVVDLTCCALDNRQVLTFTVPCLYCCVSQSSKGLNGSSLWLPHEFVSSFLVSVATLKVSITSRLESFGEPQTLGVVWWLHCSLSLRPAFRDHKAVFACVDYQSLVCMFWRQRFHPHTNTRARMDSSS